MSQTIEIIEEEQQSTSTTKQDELSKYVLAAVVLGALGVFGSISL